MFTDEDIATLKQVIQDQLGRNEPSPDTIKVTLGGMQRFLARLEAAESALDSYDRLYHAYDDESLDEYKRWLKAAGRG